MKKSLLVVSICLVVLSLSSAASARYRYRSSYIGASIGLAMVDSQPAELDTGLGLGVTLGYDTGNIRAEGEVFYQKNDFGETSYDGVGIQLEGDASSLAFMLNVYFDLNNDTAFTPYITGGIGGARIEVSDFNVSGASNVDVSGNDTVVAVQVGLGAGYAVTETFAIDVKYRYFTNEDAQVTGINSKYSGHQVLAGVRISF